jgi:hypothetical protein
MSTSTSEGRADRPVRVHPRHRDGGDVRQVRRRTGRADRRADTLAVALADAVRVYAVLRADRPAVPDGRAGVPDFSDRHAEADARSDTETRRPAVGTGPRREAAAEARTDAQADTETHAQADAGSDAQTHAATDRGAATDTRPDAHAVQRIARPVQARRQADQEAQVSAL